MTIKIQRGYVTLRAITFYPDLDISQPVLAARGEGVKLGMGVRCCVGVGEPTSKGAWMTTVRRGSPIFAWIDADDLCPIERAEEEGVSPYFPN